jgi:chromate transporter
MPEAIKHSVYMNARIVFLVFLRLGLTSFGGPVAHIAYFRDEFVVRRRWLSEQSYADLVALCQFLPGPSSSQVGMAIGLTRSGWLGAFAAWAGFTLPSAVFLVLAVQGLSLWGGEMSGAMLHGLKLVAVAVVAQAVWAMARQLCTDSVRIAIAIVSALLVVSWSNMFAQLLVIIVAGCIGALVLRSSVQAAHTSFSVRLSRRVGIVLLMLFFILLFALPVAVQIWPAQWLSVVSAFYRAGSLVFGGGHVVLPLLQVATVPPGWIDNDTFIAGYGLAQAVPGPLFSFAAFLGASMDLGYGSWAGALICLVALFAPSFLLLGGVLPFWEAMRGNSHLRAALAGVNAAVVGLLLAALYQPIWTSAVFGWVDVLLVLVALAALMYGKLPPWLLVLLYGVFGALSAFLL